MDRWDGRPLANLPDEAWIYNWTSDSIQRGNGNPAVAKDNLINLATTPASSTSKEASSFVECVLLSVFGTLIGLFFVFQLILYVRFCVTGNHDWKWSLPYLLRMRRITCRERVGHEREGRDGKRNLTKRWSFSDSSSASTVWAHMYPSRPNPATIPCRPGFFFTTRSLSSYFRSARSARQVSAGGGSSDQFPTALFMVDPRQQQDRRISLTQSAAMRTSRPGCVGVPPDPTQQSEVAVLFQCENPGYESDASLGLSPTDDEGTTDGPTDGGDTSGPSGVSPGPAMLREGNYSDDSLTSISSISVLSLAGTRIPSDTYRPTRHNPSHKSSRSNRINTCNGIYRRHSNSNTAIGGVGSKIKPCLIEQHNNVSSITIRDNNNAWDNNGPRKIAMTDENNLNRHENKATRKSDTHVREKMEAFTSYVNGRHKTAAQGHQRRCKFQDEPNIHVYDSPSTENKLGLNDTTNTETTSRKATHNRGDRNNIGGQPKEFATINGQKSSLESNITRITVTAD